MTCPGRQTPARRAAGHLEGATATALATQMVREFGLSETIGPVSCSGPPAGTTALLEQESVTRDQVRALAWASMGMASERFSSTNRVSR